MKRLPRAFPSPPGQRVCPRRGRAVRPPGEWRSRGRAAGRPARAAPGPTRGRRVSGEKTAARGPRGRARAQYLTESERVHKICIPLHSVCTRRCTCVSASNLITSHITHIPTHHTHTRTSDQPAATRPGSLPQNSKARRSRPGIVESGAGFASSSLDSVDGEAATTHRMGTPARRV